jgi:molybdate transport system substrate-binding protein
MNRPWATAAVAILLLGATACGSGASGATTSRTSNGHLTVFAAASLKASFTRIGAQFEKSRPGTTVSFSFAGSSDLVSQLQQGAPADVFASADLRNMAKATRDSLTASTPVDFASNTLEIAVPPGNPGHVASLADLTKPGVSVVVCAPAVPCGAAAVKVEQAAGIRLTPVSEEQSVTDVLGKVRSGEADAGLVYVTDVKGAGSAVVGVPFPQSSAAVNVYPIATLKTSTDAALAQAFVDAVTGSPGQGILAAAGFRPAP